VEVTLRGMGMTAILSNDGRFTFSGVAERPAGRKKT
jgi:hypothetical protein